MNAVTGKNRISLKEFVAATGVILSLLFVGLEIRQNTLAVRSSTLQALSDSHRDLVLGSLLSEEHSALITRTFQGETADAFTDHDNTRLFGYYVVYISHLQNTYMQRAAGVIDDDVRHISRNGANAPWLPPRVRPSRTSSGSGERSTSPSLG